VRVRSDEASSVTPSGPSLAVRDPVVHGAQTLGVDALLTAALRTHLRLATVAFFGAGMLVPVVVQAEQHGSPVEVRGAVAHRFHPLTKTYWEYPSPTLWPLWREALARHRSLPKRRYRRHLLWRYSVIWTKPLE
jgi:hypothetical protein